MPDPKFSVEGVLVYLSEFYLPGRGVIYDPATKISFAAEGVSVYLKRHSVLAVGQAMKTASAWFSSVGYKSLIPAHGRWLVTAVKRKAKRAVYPVEASIIIPLDLYLLAKGYAVSVGKEVFKATGLVHIKAAYRFIARGDRAGETFYLLKVRGFKSFAKKCGYLAEAVSAEGQKLRHKVRGTLGQKQKLFLQATGHLGSQIVSMMYSLKGYLPKIAFVAAVPKKYQDFMTNKRWFR